MMLTDVQWTMLEPLVEACRPHAKVPPSHLATVLQSLHNHIGIIVAPPLQRHHNF